MSMGSNVLGDSTQAIVNEVMTHTNGTTFAKVTYIDSMVRHDLFGKQSTWILCPNTTATGDTVRVEFTYVGDKKWNTGFYKPYIEVTA